MDASDSHDKSENLNFLETTKLFLTDLECLYEMYSSVLPFLQEKDAERKKIVDEIMQVNSNSVPEDPQSSDEGKSQKIGFGTTILTSSQAEILMVNFGKIKRAEELFEKQAIVILVSRLDEYVRYLLISAIKMNLSWLKTPDMTITYKELVEVGSIESAVEGFVQKEVEDIFFGCFCHKIY